MAWCPKCGSRRVKKRKSKIRSCKHCGPLPRKPKGDAK